MADAFAVKDCVLIAISTGKRAQTLRELRDRLEDIHPSCIYYHFWGGLLYQRFDDPEFQNDFASWSYHGLNDLRLAERLGIVDPTDYDDLEDLRREVIEVIEERLDESEIVPWSKADKQFYFMRSKIVVFDTGVRCESPKALGEAIAHLPVSSIFYHFIDARRRSLYGRDKRDDFSRWLSEVGGEYNELAQRIAEIDPYFASLSELRNQIVHAFDTFMQVRR
jgi:hypothetical protein